MLKDNKSFLATAPQKRLKCTPQADMGSYIVTQVWSGLRQSEQSAAFYSFYFANSRFPVSS